MAEFLRIAITTSSGCAKGLFLVNEGGKYDDLLSQQKEAWIKAGNDEKKIKYVIDDSLKEKIKLPFKIILRTKVTINNKYVERKKLYTYKEKTSFVKAVMDISKAKDDFRDDAVVIKAPEQLKKEQKKVTNGTLGADWDAYMEKRITNNDLSKGNIATQILTFNKWVRPAIGEYQTKAIDTDDLQNIVNFMRNEGKATRTTKLIKDYLRPFFKDAKIIPNPAVDIVIPKFDNEVDFSLSDEKASELMSAMESYPEPTINGIFAFLLDGRRLGETLLLKWEFINFDTNEYTIHGLTAKSGKTNSYTIQDELAQSLKNIPRVSEYVFPAMKDVSKPMSKETVRNHWEKITAEIGIKMRIHDIRHLIGGTLVNLGESLETIAAVLGHSSTAVTKRYSTVKKETASNAVNKFRKAINKDNSSQVNVGID